MAKKEPLLKAHIENHINVALIRKADWTNVAPPK